ncbi:Carotenoid biosynthesis protein [anaerobic digester metagenome]
MSARLPGAGSILFLLLGLAIHHVPETPFDPLIGAGLIVLLALPSYFVLARSEGMGRALALITGLSLLSMTVEAIGVMTGVPYGSFHYGEAIGSATIGPVPWTVGFAYVPLLLGACALAGQYLPERSLRVRAGASALLLVVADLVLDPGAALLGFWTWAEPGAYYGIPVSNYVGWLITGTAYSALTLSVIRHPLPVSAATSLLLITSFWTGVALGAGMVAPLAIGLCLIGFAATTLALGRGRTPCRL